MMVVPRVVVRDSSLHVLIPVEPGSYGWLGMSTSGIIMGRVADARVAQAVLVVDEFKAPSQLSNRCLV
jgi:hypothetical protein